jgi:hypothetical protein
MRRDGMTESYLGAARTEEELRERLDAANSAYMDLHFEDHGYRRCVKCNLWTPGDRMTGGECVKCASNVLWKQQHKEG